MKSKTTQIIFVIGLVIAFGFTVRDVSAFSFEVSYSAWNYPNHYIRHQNFLGELTRISTESDRKDASFKQVPGLAGSCISFESKNYPGYYLRHENFRIKLHKMVDSDLFRKDTTFCQRQALKTGSNPEHPFGSVYVSFESVNYPGRYIRHRNFHLYIDSGNDELFRKDATFRRSTVLW